MSTEKNSFDDIKTVSVSVHETAIKIEVSYLDAYAYHKYGKPYYKDGGFGKAFYYEVTKQVNADIKALSVKYNTHKMKVLKFLIILEISEFKNKEILLKKYKEFFEQELDKEHEEKK